MERTYTVNYEDILSFLRTGEDCKVEFYKDGTTAVFPIEAQGYPNIMKQEFYVYDYQQCDTEKEYKDFISVCYIKPLVNEDYSSNRGEDYKDGYETEITIKFK